MLELTFESTQTLTQAEFARWLRHRASSDPNHYELLNGRVVMNPPAGYPHGSIESRVVAFLVKTAGASAPGEVLGSSQGFDLPSGDTVEPDASFVSRRRWEQMAPPEPGAFLAVVPELVVEILSPSTALRDRGEKKAVYERNGVAELWLVDPVARTLAVFFNRGGERFDAGQVFGERDAFESAVLGGASVRVGDLLP